MPTTAISPRRLLSLFMIAAGVASTAVAQTLQPYRQMVVVTAAR